MYNRKFGEREVELIIDAHVHTGRHHLQIEGINTLLKRAGIDKAVIFADPESSDIPGDSAYVLAVARDLDFIPFYYFGGNAYSTKRPFPELKVPSNFAAYKGVKWHCWFTPAHDAGGFYSPKLSAGPEELLSEPGFIAVMEEVRRLGIPVNFEEHFDITREFVRRYPDINIIIPHMGALNGGEEKVLREFWDNQNVHFDTSLGYVDERIVRGLGAHRLLLGSDYPYGSPHSNLHNIMSLDLTEEEKTAILSGNVLRLVGG